MGLEDDASAFCLDLAGCVPSLPVDLNKSKYYNQCRHRENQCQPQNGKDAHPRLSAVRLVRHGWFGAVDEHSVFIC